MTDQRFRITIRGDGFELRGYMDGEPSNLSDLADKMEPFGVVVASPAADDYSPFHEQNLREIHHFETEQIITKIEDLLTKTFGSQYKDEFQEGRMSLANQIADLLGYEKD